jgi:hypothetical protein
MALWANQGRLSTPTWVFIPKCHGLPFRVWCISVALLVSVLGRTRSDDDGGIHDGARAQLQALRLQDLADLGKQGCAQIVLLTQAAELQQRGPIGNTFTPEINAHEATQCRAVDQGFLAGLVGLRHGSKPSP